MKKNFLQDVIPPSQRRSIRDIPIPNHKTKSLDDNSENEDFKNNNRQFHTNGEIRIKKNNNTSDSVSGYSENSNVYDDEYENNNNNYYFDNENKSDRKIVKLFFLVILILFISAFLLINRPKAEIFVVPKTEKFTSEKVYNIADANNANNTELLQYDRLSIKKEATVLVEPSGEEQVNQKASGLIKIINKYSSDKQTLVENTRFETSKGLIYRIAESVTVPGYSESEQGIIPGEIEVEVFADEAGDDYNIDKTDFTVPGFEGLPQFETIYAEGLSDMTGGFVGNKKVVSEEDKSQGLIDLRNNIKKQIKEEIQNYTNEFVIIYNEKDIEYSNLSENDLDDGVELKISAQVETYAFNASELASHVIEQNIPNAPNNSVLISNSEELTFEVILTSTEDEDDENSVEANEQLKINGQIQIKWIINEDELKQILAGNNRDRFNELIGEFNEISKAEIDYAPFWRNKLPKPERIIITTQDVD